jgi:hypothetical protein
LTEPQRELARLLGRLLAERWQQEQQKKQAAGPDELTKREACNSLTPSTFA